MANVNLSKTAIFTISGKRALLYFKEKKAVMTDVPSGEQASATLYSMGTMSLSSFNEKTLNEFN